MNTQPRDKKGRFVRIKSSVVDMNTDWMFKYDSKPASIKDKIRVVLEQTCELRQDIIDNQRSTIDSLMMLSVKEKTYKAMKRQFNRKLILFTSIAFILGTIFFMIISKSK